MLKPPNPLPSDPTELWVTAEGLVELAREQALRIAKLEHQLKGHQRHRFGSKSETADQLNLRLEEEETADARATPPDVESEPQQKPKRKPLPPTLPRHEDVLSPGETCTCGGKLRSLGEDVTEELEYRPGQFVVNRPARQRRARVFVCRPLADGAPAHGLQ